MGTLSALKPCGCVAKTSDEAIQLLYSGQHRSVIMYSSNSKTLSKALREVYEVIRERNQSVPDVGQQMLPTEPYYWDDIDGCLAVRCAEISVDTVSASEGYLFLFSKPMHNCLSKS